MTDKEAYQRLYGDLVYCVEKYYPKKLKMDGAVKNFIQALQNTAGLGGEQLAYQQQCRCNCQQKQSGLLGSLWF